MSKMKSLASFLILVCFITGYASGRPNKRLLESDESMIAQLKAKVQAIQGQYIFTPMAFACNKA